MRYSLKLLSNERLRIYSKMSNRVAHSFDKAKLEAVCLRRFFFAPAFEIYGGEFASERRMLY